MNELRLRDYLQRSLSGAELGRVPKAPLRTTSAGPPVARSAASAAPPPVDAWEGLRLVQKTNEMYFRLYFGLLLVAFVATVVVAFAWRSELGGLGAVLGAGGIVQGGLVLRLSSEWKEKARVDIVAALARALPPKELAPVLKSLLDGIRK